MAGSFFASKIAYFTAVSSRVCSEFLFFKKTGRNGTDGFCLSLGTISNCTIRKQLFCQEYRSLLPYCSVENQKNDGSQMSPFSIEKKPLRYYKFYFLIYYLHFKLIFPYLVQLRNICINTFNTNPKSQHHSISKLKNNFFFKKKNLLTCWYFLVSSYYQFKVTALKSKIFTVF